MYQIGPKIRHVSRWLGIIAGGLAVLAIAFAAALPSAVDDEAIRQKLSQSLSAWSGGPVEISGPVRIASFADLSIEASGVYLKSTPGLDPVSRVQAQSVTVAVRLSSLLRGELDFKKFAVASPRIVLRRSHPEPLFSSYGLGAARLALSLSARSPFTDVEFRDPVFFLAADGKAAYQRVKLNQIKLGKVAIASVSTSVLVANAPGADAGFFDLDVTSGDFEAFFRGQCTAGCQTAFGDLRLRTGFKSSDAQAMLASLAPWERPQMLAVSADLNWSKGRAALDNAAISFGDHSAKGSLALDLRGSRPRLEGTIAYDTLDLTPAWMAGGETGGESRPLAALPFARPDAGRPADFDLRVSADSFRAGSFETGPLAFALTATMDRVSIDIAAMALFGGDATGRLEVNASQQVSLSLRGSGSDLDAAALSSALQLPQGFTGPVAVQVALTMPLTMKPPVEDIGAASGTFGIRFPSGGLIEGDMARMLSGPVAGQNAVWGLGGSSFPFDGASIEGTLKGGSIDLKVQGESGDKGIEGRLRVGLPDGLVSGTFVTNDRGNDAKAAGPTSVLQDRAGSTQLVLSGTADALVLSSIPKPSLSN